MGEEALELTVELCRQRLVVAQHQCGLVHLCNHVGNGEGLAGAGDTQQGLIRNLVAQPFHKRPDRFGLVASRFVF